MRRYVKDIFDMTVFIESIKDDVVSIRTNKHDGSYFLETRNTVVLDEDGEIYILNFCCIDKENFKMGDYFVSWSFIFRLNNEQANYLKVFNEAFFEDGPRWGNKNKKSNTLNNLEKALSSIGDYEDILKRMGIYSDIFHYTTYCFFNKIENSYMEGKKYEKIC